VVANPAISNILFIVYLAFGPDAVGDSEPDKPIDKKEKNQNTKERADGNIGGKEAKPENHKNPRNKRR
jgi:hypothetical protein